MISKKNIFLFIASIIYSIASQAQNKESSYQKLSLQHTFKDAFFIGAALNSDQYKELNTDEVSIINKEFNSITPENDMKWNTIHPTKDSFNFKPADAYVSFGKKNNKHIVGHTLIWHSQLAPWVKKTDDADTLTHVITNHINKIVGRYKGKIDAWDVLNEALNEDGSPRESVFYKVMGGENYIELAFSTAAKADPDAKLVYNDYNLCIPSKRKGAERIVTNLKDKDIRIDAVGIQAHWNLTEPSIETIEKTIEKFHSLGVQVLFTELDITVLPNPWDLEGAAVEQNFERFENDKKMNPYPKKLPKKIQQQLSKRYEDIFKLFLKHKDKIERVTFWGVTDNNSWLNNWPIKGRTNYPLLFDRNNTPKNAYYKINSLNQ